MASRGRGRGGGGAGGTLAARYAQQNVGQGARVQVEHGSAAVVANGPPPLFPQMDVPIGGEFTDEERLCVGYLHKMKRSWEESPFYLTSVQPECDVERYSTKYQKTHREKLALNEIPFDKALFPAEVLGQKRKVLGNVDKGEAAPVGSALKALEAAAERANGAGADERKKSDGDEENAEDEDLEELEEEEEDEDDNDYTEAYFDNGEGGDESDGGGDEDGGVF